MEQVMIKSDLIIKTRHDFKDEDEKTETILETELYLNGRINPIYLPSLNKRVYLRFHFKSESLQL